MVVIKPCSTPNSSSNTLAIGAKQFVVHEALETMRSSAVKMSSFTPNTTVLSSPFAGAEMTTLPAPASRCKPAFSLLVNTPVDSTTTSMQREPHGRFDGSRSAEILMVEPLTTRFPPATSTVPLNRPWMLSNFSKCARVSTSVKSLMATTARSLRSNI